jgi:branched-chain amino acid transport system substrate-binding protein
MKRTWIFVVVLGLLLASCAPAATAVPTQAPAPATQAPAPATQAPAPATQAPAPTTAACATTIKIGLIAAMTGTNAILGDYMVKAVTLAMEEQNAKGGINGCKMELIVYDDAADPTTSVGLAQKALTQDKVMAAWATTNSSSALADIPIFQQYKTTQITFGTNVTITQKGSPYIFRSCPAGPSYEDPLIDYLVKTKSFTKFAIIGDNSAYGKGETQYQTAALKRNNLTPLAAEEYAVDDKDFTGQLTKIMNTQPEVLLLASSEVAGGLIAKQARARGFTGVIAGGSAMASTKFTETAGADAEGVYFTSPYPGNDYNDQTKAFAAAYKARWNVEAELHGANVYDGQNMLMLAMQKANPLTPENVAAEMHKVCGYKGLLGTFCYDETGEGIKTTFVGIIKGGVQTFLK